MKDNDKGRAIKIFSAITIICLVLAMLPASAASGPVPTPGRKIMTAPYDIGTPTLTDVWVDPINGNDANSGATRGQALNTLREAWERIPMDVNLSTTGYRIQLVAGIYDVEHIPINGWMEGRRGTYQYPIIINAVDGAGTVRITDSLNIYRCSYLYLIGLRLECQFDYVLHIASVDHFLLKQTRLIGLGDIYSYDSPMQTLKGNQCQYVYVEDCDISGAYWQVFDYVAVQYGHVINSKIYHGMDWVMYVKGGSAYLTIEGNELYDCDNGGFSAGDGTGFEYMESPWIHYEAYDIKFINNVIHDTTGAGMGYWGGYNILLAYNTLYRVGNRSHGMEFVHGLRQCDGNFAKCTGYLAMGGWGINVSGIQEPVPGRNIYVYNNILYNPPGFQSQWGQFWFEAPMDASAGSNIPNPSNAQTNLRVRGNIIWNGPPDLPLGDYIPDQPYCNAVQLPIDNYINTLQPQLIDPAHGDFRPVPGGNIFTAVTYPIPNFPGNDRPQPPLAPQGDLNNTVLFDKEGRLRTSTTPPGAYTGMTGPALDAIMVSNTIPASMNAGQVYSVEVMVRNNGSMTWNETSLIRLGAVGDATGEAALFSAIRIPISAGQNVTPGSQYTFTFSMTAPAATGTYHPSYRMVRNGVSWFGQALDKTIVVSGSAPVMDAIMLSNTIPATMTAGDPYSVSVTVRNNGTLPWNETAMVRLGAVGDSGGDAAQFGALRVLLPPGTSVNPGTNYTFTFTMTAPLATGMYHPAYHMVWDGHQWFGQTLTKTVNVTWAPQPLDAVIVSNTIPSTMTAGVAYPVIVTVRNNGSLSWNATALIRLGAVGDASGDAAKFGPLRVLIPGGTNVAPGSLYNFSFTMTAPDIANTYNPSYRMVKDGVAWFGQTLTKSVVVSGGANTVNATVVSNTVPANMIAAQTYNISITMRNTGTRAWSQDDLIRLGAVGDDMGQAALFGPTRVFIEPGVIVNPSQEYTWYFNMIAPVTPMTYHPEYRMVWDGQKWFGQTLRLTINVTSSSPIDPPATPQRLIFIHHSTGEAWLADDYGGLGEALMNNNYYVSDTNYGWGPEEIGSYTDIGNWWQWFRGPDSATYLAALYAEDGQHSSYTRMATSPGGPNEIIMFKSCFPNSALGGSPSDPVPPIGSNPLRGQDAYSPYMTVANAKGIYIDLLDYFATRQDKLFVVITAPPLIDGTYASNARAFNQWLVNDWLDSYPYDNVYVWDFYNVLTSNGGSPTVNDLNATTGNHHRWWSGAVQHKTDGGYNTLQYPTGDDHPSRAGDQKATGEYLALLNYAYNRWNS